MTQFLKVSLILAFILLIACSDKVNEPNIDNNNLPDINWFPIMQGNTWEYEVNSRVGDSFGRKYIGMEKWEIIDVKNENEFKMSSTFNGVIVYYGNNPEDTVNYTDEKTVADLIIENKKLVVKYYESVGTSSFLFVFNKTYPIGAFKIILPQSLEDTLTINQKSYPRNYLNYQLKKDVGFTNIDSYYNPTGSGSYEINYNLVSFNSP